MRVLMYGLLGMAVLTGCGAATSAAADGTGGSSNSGSSGGATVDKARERETVVATCMKQRGFDYTPSVSRPKKPAANPADYAVMKADRAKNGFGVFSAVVYSQPPQSQAPDPNQAAIESLSGAKRDAYLKALNECRVSALRQVNGLKVTSVEDYQDQMSTEIENIDKVLDGDPKLLQLAAPFAECLKSKGERVTSTKPLALSVRGIEVWMKQSEQLGKISAAEARPYLAKEIKSALTDLECGKDFYAAFLPQQQRLTNEARVKYGFQER
ncbi:hypothetical protein AB0I81_57630 [Nonomuraea sp. NPDC050404]|uniref:hypothetical protein n=1 Tax=Nonomuraea sp. NPDC050404 TaxID=3155783 RepID=UPI0034099F0C